MSRKAEILRGIVKKNPEPARGKSGTDPFDPWNAKSGLAEASEEELLKRYLKSRGINPDFIPKDTKIAHSKSAAYLSWRKNHEFDESVEILEAVDKEDTITFDIPLLIRMFEYAREDAKTDMDLHKVVEKLIKIRKKGTLTMKDYKFVTSIREEVQSAGVQLNELSPELLNRYRDKAGESAKELANKGEYKKSNKRWMGHMKSTGKQIEKMFNKEDVFHGSTAATQMPFDGANNPDDVIPAKRKNMKEMSKSARIILGF